MQEDQENHVGASQDNQKKNESTREKRRAQKTQREAARRLTLPNVITMGRICFVPVLGWLIATGEYQTAMMGLFAASASDWLDGAIARRYDMGSALGSFLDPLADKFMVMTVALSLGYAEQLPPWLVFIVVGRDAILVSGSLIHRAWTKGKEDVFFDVESLAYTVEPSTLSKANTALQFSTLWMALSHASFEIPGETFMTGLFVATAAATVGSGASYWVNSGFQPHSPLVANIRDTVKRQEQRLESKTEEAKDKVKGRVLVKTEKARIKVKNRSAKVKETTEWAREKVRESTERATRVVKDRSGKAK
ncbi:unnamed protein product [Chrysoparadoxa australica]